MIDVFLCVCVRACVRSLCHKDRDDLLKLSIVHAAKNHTLTFTLSCFLCLFVIGLDAVRCTKA